MAQCLHPYHVKQDDVSIAVPCGKCEPCTKRRVSGWSFRLMQEDRVSETSFFLTLTYNTDHVPITKNGFMDLQKRDLQLFFKRLRISQDRNSRGRSATIKYYACGEYGGKTYRPHYHVILFNAQLEYLIGKVEADMFYRKSLILDGKVSYECPSWPKGHVTVGLVSEASVGYTCKYIHKASRIPMHRNDDRQKEFSLMSKGLGKSYISKKSVSWHHDDVLNRMYLTVSDGKKIAMPRYYKDKIYASDVRSVIAGYQKGEMEKKFLEEVANGRCVHDYKEAVKASDRRHKMEAENNRNSI